MSLRLSLPMPTRMADICCRSPAINASAVSSPTATTNGIAMQRWPQEPNAAPIKALTLPAMSASGSTTAWFFAPPSACTRLFWPQPVW
ncbi:hypothetical protein D3C87_1819900 [compost metagenome]